MSNADVWVAVGSGYIVPGYLLAVPAFEDFATFASHKSLEHRPLWVVTNMETGTKVAAAAKTRKRAEDLAVKRLASVTRQKLRAAMLKAERENKKLGR